MPAPLIQGVQCRWALLLASTGCAWLGCSSSYDPEAQFWPNLGPVSFGIGTTGPDAGTGAEPPLPGAGQVDDEGTGGGSAGTIGASNSAGGGGPIRETAGGGNSTGGSSATASAGSSATASSTCSLSVSVTTTAPGGRYQPRNVGAIWIADDSGGFIKSLDVWGNRRLSHVTAWNAATRAAGVPGNKVDAVSSATLTAHRAHNVSWNCEDYDGQAVPDGSYRVYFEVTDSNNSGPNHFETFTKGSTASTAQASATNFNGIVLTFTP
jgi:hypothetical protein